MSPPSHLRDNSPLSAQSVHYLKTRPPEKFIGERLLFFAAAALQPINATMRQVLRGSDFHLFTAALCVVMRHHPQEGGGDVILSNI